MKNQMIMKNNNKNKSSKNFIKFQILYNRDSKLYIIDIEIKNTLIMQIVNKRYSNFNQKANEAYI